MGFHNSLINQFAKITPVVDDDGYILSLDEDTMEYVATGVMLKTNELGICLSKNCIVTKDATDTIVTIGNATSGNYEEYSTRGTMKFSITENMSFATQDVEYSFSNEDIDAGKNYIVTDITVDIDMDNKVTGKSKNGTRVSNGFNFYDKSTSAMVTSYDPQCVILHFYANAATGTTKKHLYIPVSSTSSNTIENNNGGVEGTYLINAIFRGPFKLRVREDNKANNTYVCYAKDETTNTYTSVPINVIVNYIILG